MLRRRNVFVHLQIELALLFHLSTNSRFTLTLPFHPVEHSTIYHGTRKSKRDISRKEFEKVGTTAQVASESRWSSNVIHVGCGTNCTCMDLLTRFPSVVAHLNYPIHMYAFCMSIMYRAVIHNLAILTTRLRWQPRLKLRKHCKRSKR